MRSLEEARDYLESLDRHGESRGLAGEWLLDNYHLIEAQATEIRNALPLDYYRALPKLIDPPVGCRFAPRCRFATAACTAATPPLREVGVGHKVACILDVGVGAA